MYLYLSNFLTKKIYNEKSPYFIYGDFSREYSVGQSVFLYIGMIRVVLIYYSINYNIVSTIFL